MEIRWKQGRRWRYGHAVTDTVAADGSVLAYDERNGAARSLLPERVERLESGPRGGRRWTPWGSDGGAIRVELVFRVSALLFVAGLVAGLMCG